MPRKTWDTKADFDGAYSIRLDRYTGGTPQGQSEQRGNYDRRALFNSSIPQLDYVTPEWSNILAHFRWPVSTSIFILGAGFGWSIEYLNSRGYADVWGVDSSLYVQGAKDEIDLIDSTKRSLVSARIHDADFSTSSEVSRFLLDSAHRKDIGGESPFDVCITERVLTSLEDSEAVTLSANLRTLDVIKPAGQVIHIENSQEPGLGRDPTMNWKTLSQWKVLLPDDIFVRSGGAEFLS